MTSAAKASEQVVEAAGAASVPVDGAGAELFEGEIGGSTGMEVTTIFPVTHLIIDTS